MEKIDKAIEILQAFKEGKSIMRNCLESTSTFADYKILNEDVILEWLRKEPNSLYIKKEPTYRPYSSAEEFLKASKEHGGWISHKTNIKELYLITNVDVTNNCVMVVHQMGNSYHCGCNFYSFEFLFTNFIWVDDNTPCGILEQ